MLVKKFFIYLFIVLSLLIKKIKINYWVVSLKVLWGIGLSIVCVYNCSSTFKIDHHVGKLFYSHIWCSQRISCWRINIRLKRSKMLSLEIKLLNYCSWSKNKTCRYNSKSWQFRLCRLVQLPSLSLCFLLFYCKYTTHALALEWACNFTRRLLTYVGGDVNWSRGHWRIVILFWYMQVSMKVFLLYGRLFFFISSSMVDLNSL